MTTDTIAVIVGEMLSVARFGDVSRETVEDWADRLAALGWQPIETAPKGEDIDVWNGKRYADATWCYPSFGKNGQACWCEQRYQHGYGWESYRIEPQPTHWQPLPTPPAQCEQAEVTRE